MAALDHAGLLPLLTLSVVLLPGLIVTLLMPRGWHP